MTAAVHVAHYSHAVRRGHRINDGTWRRTTLCGVKPDSVDLAAPSCVEEHAANLEWFARHLDRALCRNCAIHAERTRGERRTA